MNRGWFKGRGLFGSLLAGLVFAGTLVVQGAVAQVTVTYTYDDLGRLITTSNSDDSAQVDHTYDAAGNRTGVTISNVPARFAVAAPVAEGGDLLFTVSRTGDTSAALDILYSTVAATIRFLRESSGRNAIALTSEIREASNIGGTTRRNFDIGNFSGWSIVEKVV